jgi:hypothetical protein
MTFKYFNSLKCSLYLLSFGTTILYYSLSFKQPIFFLPVIFGFNFHLIVIQCPPFKFWTFHFDGTKMQSVDDILISFLSSSVLVSVSVLVFFVKTNSEVPSIRHFSWCFGGESFASWYNKISKFISKVFKSSEITNF